MPLNVTGNDHLPLFALLCFGSNCNDETNSKHVVNKPITVVEKSQPVVEKSQPVVEKSQPVVEVRGGKIILSYNINYS